MSRTITPAQQAEVAKNITTPIYLVELGFNTPLYYSSRQQVLYGGNTFTEDKLTKVALKDTKGIMSARLHISNIDLNIGNTAIAETLQGKTCKVYIDYTIAGTTSDAILLLDGIVNEISNINTKEVVLNATSISVNIAYSPRIYCAPPLFNHAVPAGTLINWGGSVYEIKGDS